MSVFMSVLLLVDSNWLLPGTTQLDFLPSVLRSENRLRSCDLHESNMIIYKVRLSTGLGRQELTLQSGILASMLYHLWYRHLTRKA
jgi:hypothetical protein